VPLFAGLAEEDLEQLAAALRRRRFQSGEVIFVQGDPGTNLYLVESGLVKLCFVDDVTGREIILDLIGEREVFGELALLDGEPRSADAVAVDPTSLLLLARDEFLRILHARPRVATRLIEELSRRLRRDAKLLQDASFRDVPARVARTLLRLSQSTQGPGKGAIRLKQADLARMAGTTRETTSTVLREFEDLGYIERDTRGRVTVLQPEALSRRIS
jgi:CRP/FNR family transcriptional regulator, cyclic AMP receptor protein